MSWCGAACGMSPSISSLIQSKLKEIRLIYPSIELLTLINSDGKLITTQNYQSIPLNGDVFSSISSLKKCALQFCSALNQSSCPIVHIRGQAHLFSLYDVGKAILAFFTQFNAIELEQFSTADADEKMQPILTELKLLINNIR